MKTEPRRREFLQVVTAAALTLRVQAVNSTIKGPFSSVSVPAPKLLVLSKA